MQKTENYIRLVGKLSKYDRSLNKYKRRKTLKPQEKAAITKAKNKFKEVVNLNSAESTKRLRSLTKSQIKALKDKSVLIPGTNSILVDPNAGKISIRKGKIISEVGKRNITYLKTFPSVEAVIEAAEIIFKRENKKYIYHVAPWLENGAYNFFFDFESFSEFVENLFSSESHAYNVPEGIIQGIAYFREEK